jgi:hypothetical protein
MKRFIQSTDRTQVTLFPEQLEDYVGDDNPVRVVDVFVEQLPALSAICRLWKPLTAKSLPILPKPKSSV